MAQTPNAKGYRFECGNYTQHLTVRVIGSNDDPNSVTQNDDDYAVNDFEEENDPYDDIETQFVTRGVAIAFYNSARGRV